MKRVSLLFAVLLLFAAALFVGCEANENENKNNETENKDKEEQAQEQEQESSITGRLFLVVGDSEVTISYSGEGEVQYLTGNEEITGAAEACQGLIGSDCAEAVKGVLAEMKAQGVFDETAWGNEKVIILRMNDETGTDDSGEPNGLLYRELDQTLAGTIQELGIASPYILIDSEDYYQEKNPQYDGRKRDFITAQMAETIAYTQGGFADYPDPAHLYYNSDKYKTYSSGYMGENGNWVEQWYYPEIEVYEIEYSELRGGTYVCRVDGQSGMLLEILYKESIMIEDSIIVSENGGYWYETEEVFEVMPPSEPLSDHFGTHIQPIDEEFQWNGDFGM